MPTTYTRTCVSYSVPARPGGQARVDGAAAGELGALFDRCDGSPRFMCIHKITHNPPSPNTNPPPNHTTKTARGRPRRPRPDPVRPPPASHRPGGARFFVTHRPRLGLASRGGAADVVGVVGHRGGIPTRVYMGFYLYVPIPPRPPTRRICVCVCVF